MSEEILHDGAYSLIFTYNGEPIALSYQKCENESIKLVPKTPNSDDQTQIWFYSSIFHMFTSAVDPQKCFTDSSTESSSSPIVLQDISSDRDDTSTHFYLNRGRICNSSLQKFLSYSRTEEDSFNLTEGVTEGLEFELRPIDVSDMILTCPPVGIPFAFVYTYAADFRALTLDVSSSQNGEGKRIKTDRFIPGKDPYQYFFYIPYRQDAIMSAAMSNQALDDINNGESECLIYTHHHHGESNQRWLFKDGFVEGQRQNKVLTLKSEDGTTHASPPGDSYGIQKFMITPLFDELEGINDITHFEDNISDPEYSIYTDSDNDSSTTTSEYSY